MPRDPEILHQEIRAQLQKIASLLGDILAELRKPPPMFTVTEGEAIPLREPFQTTIEPKCNCQNHRPGMLTAGWVCPVHGQMF